MTVLVANFAIVRLAIALPAIEKTDRTLPAHPALMTSHYCQT